MKPFFPLVLILTFYIVRISGQETTQIPGPGNKSFAVHLHTGLNQIMDKSLLPLKHSGMATEFSLEKEKIKGSLRNFEFLFTYSRLKTSFEEMAKSANVRIGLSYSFNLPVFLQENIRYYAGPKILAHYSLMTYPNWDESHIYWADCFCAGINNVLSVSLRNGTEWFSTLSFPLVGIFSRPENVRPYKMDAFTTGGIIKAFHSNLETGFINRLLLIGFDTEYRFPVLKGKREAFTFSMDITRMSEKNGSPVLQLTTMLGIKIML